jgi:hypothetical protein
MYDDDENEKFEPCEGTDLLDMNDEYCHAAGLTCEFTISAFTVAELGELLKNTGVESGNGYFRNTFWFKDKWYGTMDTKNEDPAITADTEADARAKMLIYLLENNLITL